MNNKLFVSLPYIYPVCPLNIDHSRMFIIADIIARYSRKKGKEVVFPVASHYSGNTAQNIASVFVEIYRKGKPDEKSERIFSLFKNVYGTPDYILKDFVNPLNILDYYSQEILWELKTLNVSCDYDHFYTTKQESFSSFVRTIISQYKKEGLLIENTKEELALDYDNVEWKSNAEELLNNTGFIQLFQKNIVLSAMKNVRSDWGLLRKGGYGVKYDEDWVIDPMFDSELFTIFDLYVHFKNEDLMQGIDEKKLFEELFDVLRNGVETDNLLINKIINFLPCDLFVCEEHLKNWIVKRIYAESCLSHEKYQTKKYFVTGMGLLHGKRMSASKGSAILTKDLIRLYGPVLARLIILLTGGHPSKIYHYDHNLPGQSSKMLDNFINYILYLLAIKDESTEDNPDNGNRIFLDNIEKSIEKYIENGFFKQAIVELISIIPKKYKKVDRTTADKILRIYSQYLDIFLPGLLINFNLDKKMYE